MEREKLIAIVSQAQAGSADAIECLFEVYYNDVYYFALKTVKNSDIACDITQETFLEIIRTIGNLKEPAAFGTWVKQITYHQCTRYFNKKKDVLVEEDEDGNTIFDTLADESEGSIPSEVLEKEEFRKTILDMIDQLTEEQRSAVMMYYFDELTVGQIAQIQGVSAGTVKSRLNYARKAVRKSVEDYEKKNGIKLHSFAFLPLFMLFFGKEFMPVAKVEQVRGTVVRAASVANTGTAVAAGVKTSSIAAKAVVTKVVAGVAAAAIVAGGTIFAVQRMNKEHVSEDLNADCICDCCDMQIHSLEDDHAQCAQCGQLFFNYDEDTDNVCDLCGEYRCGAAHRQPHRDEDVDGVCDMCGENLKSADDEESMPQFQYAEDYNGGALELLSVCEKMGDNFAGLLGDLDYVVTKDGKLLDQFDGLAQISTEEDPQQWFAAGAYPAYYDADGEVHIYGIWREFVCTGFAGEIVCASPYSFGAEDGLLLEDIHVYTCDDSGYLYWNRYVTHVEQERFIGTIESYNNRPTTLQDEETGNVFERVDDVAVIRPEGGNVIFVRYVADGMIYESDTWQWELLAGQASIPVKNTGVCAEDLLTDLNDAEMICKDTANNAVLLQGQSVPMPDGKTIEQIAGAWSAPWVSVIEFDDGSVYLYGFDGVLSWQYNEELTVLNQEGKIVEFMALQGYGNVLVKMDDGLLYIIKDHTR